MYPIALFRKLLPLAVASLFLCCTETFGQVETSLHLDSCLRLAKENYPLAKQKGYLHDVSENNIRGIDTKWYPQVSMVSQATHQTEATTLGDLTFPKDNYSIGLHVSQTLVDFGVNSQLKTIDRAGTQSEILKNEAELYKLNDKVLQLYGSILVAKANLQILETYTTDIRGRQANMVSSVNNGAMLQSNLDVLDVELLKTSQRQIEASANLKVLCQTLSLLIGKQVNEKTALSEIPTMVMTDSSANSTRPELQYFESQQNLINEKTKLVNRKAMPHLSAFGEGAYGTTGYDLLNTSMRLYGIAGVSLTWNISEINSNRFEKKNLYINKSMVDMQKEVFELNRKTALAQEYGEIDQLKEMIGLDSSIVGKRISISKTAGNQLENGTITSADYLSYLSAEKQAVLNEHIHEIQLGVAIKNYIITTGIKF